MKMIEDFESHETRSSGELWSEICSSLPDVQEEAQGQEGDDATLFTDSFQPSHVGNGLQSNGMSTSSSSHSVWEPMEDSDVYIASLGKVNLISNFCHVWPSTLIYGPFDGINPGPWL